MSRQKVTPMTMDQGFELIDAAVTKLKRILEGKPEPAFGSHEYIENYTIVYNMCTQKPPDDLSQQLYDKYGGIFEDYDKHTVSNDRLLIRGFLINSFLILFVCG